MSDAHSLADGHALPSGDHFHPEYLRSREWWVNWVLAVPFDDGGEPDRDATPTKQPVAPYQTHSAKPTRWNAGLEDDEHPSTDVESVELWEGARVGVDLPPVERVLSDRLGVGIIIPVGQHTRDGRTVTLIDWDDVRDPETGEIHPVCARALRECDGYAEISQSGKGIHQYVFGEIPASLVKFIRHIDDEPFVGDDLPMVEMYSSGRLSAMTGRHVTGTGRDVADGQDLIDQLVWEYGTAGNNATDTPTDPYASERGVDEAPSHDTVSDAVRDAIAYDGPDPAGWDVPADETIDYHAVLRARERSDEFTSVANWELIGYASALGHRDGLEKDEILTDLEAHPTPQYGYDDRRATTEVDNVLRKIDAGNYGPPSRRTLVERGILPDDSLPADSEGAEPVAVLPESPALRPVGSAWDWRRAGAREATDDDTDDDPLQDARDRTTAKIATAIGSGDRVLIEALPTLGKTYGAVHAAAETGDPVSILTTRGNKEQYDQIEAWCEEHGLSYARLPAFPRVCPTAAGEHGADWKRTVMDWYSRGATPKEIHALAERFHGEPTPCQHDGQCPYTTVWNAIDPDETDVLVGHYTHAYLPTVTTGRSVLFDEFVEQAFERCLDHGIEGAITYFLQEHDPIPFDDYTDLLENRGDEQRRADALTFLDEYGVDSDATAVLADSAGHAAAPAAVLTILVGGKNDLGNGWERADFPDDRTGLVDRETGTVSILDPPALDYASAVIALDGTPTKELWELTLGERLNHTQVLTDAERREYLTDALNLNLVRTTEAVKSYSPKETEIANRVSLAEDTALLEGIGETHGQRPSLITTNRAEGLYDDERALDLVADHEHYGNVLGSNVFDETRVGAVIGSRNFGPRYVTKWAAYLDEAAEPTFPAPENDFTPTEYGAVGNRIRTHMREHETLQAAMRFGRDGNGATVYVHTNTLPEWVPLAGEGRVLSTRSEGMRQVIDVATELEEWTTAEIAAHPDVEIGERQVRDHLTTLTETHDVLDRRTEGCGFVWRDDGLHRLNEHGDVELAPIELDELSDAENAEVVRTTIYRWEFRTSTDAKPETAADADRGGESPATGTVAGGDTPPSDQD